MIKGEILQRTMDMPLWLFYTPDVEPLQHIVTCGIVAGYVRRLYTGYAGYAG